MYIKVCIYTYIYTFIHIHPFRTCPFCRCACQRSLPCSCSPGLYGTSIYRMMRRRKETIFLGKPLEIITFAATSRPIRPVRPACITGTHFKSASPVEHVNRHWLSVSALVTMTMRCHKTSGTNRT